MKEKKAGNPRTSRRQSHDTSRLTSSPTASTQPKETGAVKFDSVGRNLITSPPSSYTSMGTLTTPSAECQYLSRARCLFICASCRRAPSYVSLSARARRLLRAVSTYRLSLPFDTSSCTRARQGFFEDLKLSYS